MRKVSQTGDDSVFAFHNLLFDVACHECVGVCDIIACTLYIPFAFQPFRFVACYCLFTDHIFADILCPVSNYFQQQRDQWSFI